MQITCVPYDRGSKEEPSKSGLTHIHAKVEGGKLLAVVIIHGGAGRERSLPPLSVKRRVNALR